MAPPSSTSEPLTNLIAAGGLPADTVLRIGRDLAAALAQSGVHGELWPSAIAVSEEGIGVIPAGTADRSRYGQYAAPERILGKPATPESDVFSIGAILFHALAGRPPFKGETPQQMMLSAMTEGPIELPAGVPRDLAVVVRRCLQREPAARYASPGLLRDALQSLASRDTWPGRRILLADDEPMIRDAYALVANRIGVEADVVSSGRDAIDALKSHRYDVALLDLNMPRLSGWEVLDFLRDRRENRPRKLFIITGFNDQMISEADRDLVAAVLYKPVAPEELRSLLIECLRGGDVDLRSILRTTSHRAVSAA